VSQRIPRLEALLARVQANAAQPRVSAVVVSPAAVSAAAVAAASAPVLDDLDAPGDGLPASAGAPLLELDAPDDLAVSAQQDSLLAPLSSSMRGDLGVESAPPSAVEEVMAEAAEEVDLDSMEEVDLVEEFAGDPSLEPVEDEEPPPESRSGPSRSAPNLADAISDVEEEAPLTPPPQSGEGLAIVPSHAPSPAPAPSAGPTMEQLGETIALEEGPPQEFDLGEPEAPTFDEPVTSAYEAEIPAHPSAYDDQLSVPENARAELERVRLGERTDVRAEIISRPVISTNVVDFVEADRALHPTTFGELLDLTLGL